MFHRLRHPLADMADEGSGCTGSAQCKCCSARDRARAAALFDPLPEWNNPLTPGVQLVNLSHTEDGGILRVALAADWARMFSTLSLARTGLVMTRNEAAIVGHRMTFPPLHLASDGIKAAGGAGELLLDFRHLGAAHAVHIRRRTGHVFGVEFGDASGNTIHRFTLTPESDMDEFFAWVRLHQACSADTAAAWIGNGNGEESGSIQPACSLHECGGGTLESIVSACVERAVPLRVTVRNTAATQRIEFTPRSLQDHDEWRFASDDVHGFHFQPDAFARITLEVLPCRSLRLRAIPIVGTGSLILEAGEHAAQDSWRFILETLA